MTLPNFLVIGTQKAGTTWLQHMLRQHPDVYMPSTEVHFFDKAHHYNRGLSWYQQFFEEADGETAIGEKTPDYCWTNRSGAEGHLPSVHRNIYRALPEAALILIVRNPVDRAISAANHLVRTRRVPPRYSIDQLLLGDRQDLAEEHGVIDYGRYYRHIQAYLEFFDREQLLVLVFEEDIVSDPQAGLEKVTEFLGVDACYRFEGLQERQNTAGVSKVGLYLRYYLPALKPIVQGIDKYVLGRDYKQTPTDETRRALYDLYRADNERLFCFLGRRIPEWTRGDSSTE